MEYEVFEPDLDDEYYELGCATAYAVMFNEVYLKPDEEKGDRTCKSYTTSSSSSCLS